MNRSAATRNHALIFVKLQRFYDYRERAAHSRDNVSAPISLTGYKLADQAHTIIFDRLAELKSEQSD